jgi:hypothetical protein
MGLDTRRPPLPAPTDISSLDDSSGFGTEVATNLTTKTSHTIPEDGSPITITTHRGPSSRKEGRHHHRQKSQTSLLIEYFEAGKGPNKSKSKPSVRVRVTPSSRKGSRGQDAVQITGIGKDRKPSYSRRISLTSRRPEEQGVEGTEISQSSESNVSAQPPVEVEVLNNVSDLSSARSPGSLLYAHNESNVSSMPPDSMIEGSTGDSDTAREYEPEGSMTASEAEYLKAPADSRSRSASQDRITQKVMEKINQQIAASGRRREWSGVQPSFFQPNGEPTFTWIQRISRITDDQQPSASRDGRRHHQAHDPSRDQRHQRRAESRQEPSHIRRVKARLDTSQ